MAHDDKESGDSSKEKEAPIVELCDTKWAYTDIDSVWHFLGRFGKYQVIQLSLQLYLATSTAIVVVGGMFTGKSVKFRCNIDNTSFPGFVNQSNEEVSSCYVKTINNWTSGTQSEERCTKYHYGGGDTTLSFIAEWDLICDRDTLAQLPQILTMLGMLIGATSLSHLGDRFGRWKLITCSHFCQFVVVILMAYVDRFEIFLILNVLAGIVEQGVVVPMYSMQLEVMTSEVRPFVCFLQTSAWVTSVIITGVIGYVVRDYDWRDLQLAYALSLIPGFVCLWFMDESLRWLVLNRKIKKVNKLLQKACRMNNKDYDNLMQEFVAPKKGDVEPLVTNDDEKSESSDESGYMDESFRFKTLIVNKYLRKITLTMGYIWMICSLMYYGLTLMSTSLAGDPYVNYFLTSLAELPSGVYVFYTLRKFGRKKTIMFSNGVAGLALLISVFVANLAPSTSGYRILLVCLTLIGKLTISGSFSTIWVYTPELYPTNLRNYGVGIGSTAARIGASFSPLFTMVARKAPWVPGTLFAAVCFISVFLMGPMPETRDRELPRTTRDVENWFLEDEKNDDRKENISQDSDAIC